MYNFLYVLLLNGFPTLLSESILQTTKKRNLNKKVNHILCPTLTTFVGICHAATGFSLIVKYDAIGMRRHAGAQAAVAVCLFLRSLFVLLTYGCFAYFEYS